MTTSNWIELAVLIGSLIAAVLVVRFSNQKVKDLDGLGNVSVKDDKERNIIAHF